MKLFGLKTCETCRRAFKSLENAGFSPAFVDVRATGVSRADLARFQAAFGAALVNRASTSWRNLPESRRADDPLDLMQANPALMKRPVIEHAGRLYLGWGKEVQNSLLGRDG